MSLLESMKTTCALYEKTRVPDGEGGFITEWKEGAKFMAAITLDTSIQAKIAEKQGVTGIYTVTTDKKVNLEFHDVFIRLYDGKVFRVTSDGDDKHTPESANINMRQVTAEEWKVTA